MRRILLFIISVSLITACQPTAKKVEGEKPSKELTGYEKFRIAFYQNQDRWQKYCSNEAQLVPKGISVEEFKKAMLATVKFPPDGKVMGDWRRGEKLFGDPKRGGRSRRGNCYACHCGDPQIIACGNVGPSLRGYGKRGIDPKQTYIRIYNAWAVNPCSAMPRLGYWGVLKPEEIADIVAYLHSPESPINR